ncbi:hypothetical protein NXW61_16895 [Bacteroides xylanisolvens]|nr:hypothetical protein [Bacteroides xylanisolvens]
MMKYIFCILLGVFLNWGFHLISDEAQEAYRLETGSTSIQTYTNSYTSKTSIIQLDKEQKLVKTKEYTGKQDYNNDNGVLNPFSFRHLSPFKDTTIQYSFCHYPYTKLSEDPASSKPMDRFFILYQSF